MEKSRVYGAKAYHNIRRTRIVLLGILFRFGGSNYIGHPRRILGGRVLGAQADHNVGDNAGHNREHTGEGDGDQTS